LTTVNLMEQIGRRGNGHSSFTCSRTHGTISYRQQSRAYGKHWQKCVKCSEGTPGDILLLLLEYEQFQLIKCNPTDVIPNILQQKAPPLSSEFKPHTLSSIL
jgi:hypothetical protein